MADGTAIEWTDATWNPITGCSVVSPGCTNCYAMKLAGTRLKHTPSREGLTRETKAGPVWNGEVRLNEKWLAQPIHWRRPRRIFVCAHGDLFAENVPDEWIDRVFAIMALAPQHTFQVLTKRAKRLREYVGRDETRMNVLGDGVDAELEAAGIPWNGEWGDRHSRAIAGATKWPLPNVWLGVSAEDQTRAVERVPELLATPAAVRFISAEPLLGPIQFDDFCNGHKFIDALRGNWWHDNPVGPNPVSRGHEKLDWIIVGGESGPGARPMHPAWARSIRDQCAAAGVAFFFKQWGEFAPEGPAGQKWIVRADGSSAAMPTPNGIGHHPPRDGASFVYRVGKKAAGRLLDGVEHSAFPQVAA